MFPEHKKDILHYGKEAMDIINLNGKRLTGRITSSVSAGIVHFRDNGVDISFEHYYKYAGSYVNSRCYLYDVPIDLETLPEDVYIRNKYVVFPLIDSSSKIFQN